MKKPTHNLSNEDYHRGKLKDLYSSSDLKMFYRKSGAHLEQKKQQKQIESELMFIGTAFHAMALEPELFDEEYVVQPDFEPTEIDKKTGEVKPKTRGWKNTTDYRNQVKEFQRKNAGRKILTQEQLQKLNLMHESLRRSAMYRQYFCDNNGYNEATYTSNGFKVRCDRICENGSKTTILDIKTTDDASPEAFKKKLFNMDYDLSAAMYLDIAEADEFIWVVVEREAPYSCCWYRMSDWIHQKGIQKLNIAAERLENSKLPLGGFSGYDAELFVVDL